MVALNSCSAHLTFTLALFEKVISAHFADGFLLGFFVCFFGDFLLNEQAATLSVAKQSYSSAEHALFKMQEPFAFQKVSTPPPSAFVQRG